MSIKLSKRLSKIVEMCELCDTIIDVGTDHGKVPITIANLGLAKNVIAIDNKKGPLAACEENANLYMTNRDCSFKTLLCNGLEKVDKTVESGIIITGIGYDAMSEIIKDINDYNFKYLILSPHTKINELVNLLKELNIDIVDHVEILDCKKNYHLIKAKHI